MAFWTPPRRKRHIPTIDVLSDQPVVLMSDIHIGNRYVNYEQLQRDIESFKAMGAAVLINGDLFEAITPSDKRFEMESHGHYTTNDIINQYIKDCVNLFGSIAPQIRLIGIGNHENSMIKNDHINITLLALEELERIGGQKIYYGGYHGYVRFRVVDARAKHEHAVYEMYYHHGYGGHTKSGPKLMLNDLRLKYRADIYWTGHKHQTAIFSDAEVRAHRRFEEVREVWLLSTGSYLSTAGLQMNSHTPYEVVKGFIVSSTRPCIVLHFGERVRASIY